MTNFYTPKIKQFSMLELLTFYGYSIKSDSSEVPTGGYIFCKNNTNVLMRKLGFNEVLHRSNDHKEIEIYAKSYIANNFNDAKEIKHGIYQINM